jgi:hypothetical protein
MNQNPQDLSHSPSLDLLCAERNQDLVRRDALIPASGRLEVLDRAWDRPLVAFTAPGGLAMGNALPVDGLGTLAPVRIRVRLPAPGATFTALIGLDRNQAQKAWRRPLPAFAGTAVFSIAVAGREIFNSGPTTFDRQPLAVRVELDGAQEFVLEVRTGDDRPYFAWAGWGGAVATLTDGRLLRLSAMPVTQPESGWRLREVVIAWGFARECRAHVGRLEISGGVLGPVSALNPQVEVTGLDTWQAEAATAGRRRAIAVPVLYRETDRGPDRTLVTVTLGKQVCTFLPHDLAQGPILLHDLSLGISDRDTGPTLEDHLRHLQTQGCRTIRERVRELPERFWEEDLRALRGPGFQPPELVINPREGWPPFFEPGMRVDVPDRFLNHLWRVGGWSIVRHFTRIHREDLTQFGKVPTPKSGLPYTGNLRILRDIEDPRGCWLPTGVWQPLAMEVDRVVQALDHQGLHQIARDCLDLWLENQKPDGALALDTHAERGHALGQLSLPWVMAEHYRLSGDRDWLVRQAPRLKAAVQWIIRRRRTSQVEITPEVRECIRHGQCPHPGLQPPLASGDGGGRAFILADVSAYQSVRLVADVLAEIDPPLGRELLAEADAYRDTLLPVVEAAVAASPVMRARDGRYRRYLPQGFADRGPLHLNEPAGSDIYRHWGSHLCDVAIPSTGIEFLLRSRALSLNCPWLDEVFDLFEDRFIYDHPWYHVRRPGFRPDRDWDCLGGWFYQSPHERLPEYYLQADDIPNFLRAWQRRSVVDMYFVGDPFGDTTHENYMFKEHTWFNVYDKQHNRAGFLSNFRNLLVMEQEQTLWLAHGTPRAWLEQGKKISIKNAPTHFGTVAYEIVSDVDQGKITATIELPTRRTPGSVVLRLRHPTKGPMKVASVNGRLWSEFNNDKETIILKGLSGTVSVTAQY